MAENKKVDNNKIPDIIIRSPLYRKNLIRYSKFLFFSSLLMWTSVSVCQYSTAAMIDKIMESYNHAGQPGASVLVMFHGKVVFKRGYGISNMNTGEKITSATNFRLASITKQFTAMSILILEERGLLNLNDKINKYFPDFPVYGKEISLRNLLTHSAGLVDYEDFMPATQSTQLHDMDCLQLMFSTDSLYFPAGTEYKYSNTGYALLALIVEKVSHQSFASFLASNIFKPLKMKATVAHEEGKSVVLNRAYGHSLENGIWKLTDQSLTSAVLGDGGIYSNVEDLSKWIIALYRHPLIGISKQKEAFSKATLKNGKQIDYGFGWHVEDYNGVPHPFHDGSSIGFRNSILLFPNNELMVVILTNRNEHDPKSEAIKIAELYLK